MKHTTCLKKPLNLKKKNSNYFVLQEFMDAAARKMKSDEAYSEQFIQDYLFASGVADGALKAATKENDKKLLKVAKTNIDAFFINSGVATRQLTSYLCSESGTKQN